jgi:moderate conductance mechanosensitive channel
VFVLVAGALILPAMELAGVQTFTGLDPRGLAGWLFGSGLRIGLILLLSYAVVRVTSLIIARFEQDVMETAGLEYAEQAKRVRTLGNLLRSTLIGLVFCIAVLMILRELNLDITPILTGAGIAGVAIGFGAQTLVKDIISGVFYLLDDAFRTGEYIQSGSYKGTVESFSLRSVKLRHHRGPLFTVPFGELGAVQNMSRDWVIDKMSIGITYDSDIEKARKLIKQIGKDLAADPEYAPHIIEPLKMQGVETFGDYAIQIRMKMMTKPGEQFVIRRKAYAMIKKAFDANGIKFASPTVQVAGGDEATAAAARQSLANAQAQAAPPG